MPTKTSKKIRLPSAVLAAVLAAAALTTAAAQPRPDTAPRRTLAAFADEAELTRLLQRWGEEARRRQEAQRRSAAGAMSKDLAVAPPAPAAAPAALAEAQGTADSVTNVQHAGVDEGGIVKLQGDHLLILRRGRLFTVNIAGGRLRPVDAIDAYGPGIEPGGAWYDEMLVSGDTVAVIGYSYARGGTEIGLFRLAPDGRLSYRATYHLRSNDYYSSRNYASRLVGSKLVFYAPLLLRPGWGDPYAAFPALRRWRPDATPADFRRIAPATRIYRSDEEPDPAGGLALHSVTVCELAAPELACEASAVLGPPGRVFYVSPESVFVWVASGRRAPAGGGSAVFRIPLDGSAPSALKTAGSPVDQFSFLEDADGMLNVLVRSSGRGDGMWNAQGAGGEPALLRVPLASFSDGRDSAPPEAYRALPRPAGGNWQNRFVGDYLLYGTGGDGRWRQEGGSELYAVRYADRAVTYALPLAHDIERIEALGAHALAVGGDGRDLHATPLRLTRTPVALPPYTRAGAAQGETRSHGFFYKPEGADSGLLGLPILASDRPAAWPWRSSAASLLYLRNQGLRLSELGTLDARPGAGRDDGCRASCVDWYGNARPLFVRGRVFALLGYEIVEGELSGGRIAERRRISFAPGGAGPGRDGKPHAE